MSCVTLEKSLNLYEPQSSHLFSSDGDDGDDDNSSSSSNSNNNNNNNNTKWVKSFWGLNEKRHPVSDPGELYL